MSSEDKLLSANTNPTDLSLTAEGRPVKRLNKAPLFIIGGIVLIFMLGLMFVVNKRAQKQIKIEESTAPAIVDSSQAVDNILSGAPDGVIPDGIERFNNEDPNKGVLETRELNSPRDTSNNDSLDSKQENLNKGNLSERGSDNKGEMTDYDRNVIRIRKLQEEQYMAALEGDSEVSGFSSGGGQSTNSVQQSGFNQNSSGGDRNSSLNTAAALAAAAAAGTREDPNKQVRKEEFFGSTSDNDSYLPNIRQAPLSPYEVSAGAIIPAVMINGINSDLPGLLTAQVSQNVYNTETGGHLVIPQGTKIIGRYDSQVAFGQKRVLIVWDRLVFPDNSKLNLAGMPGADQAGYAGFEDQVDNHYFKIFGSAILMSLISAGTQISQPDNNGNSNSQDARTTLSAALGQQLGEVSTELTRKNLKIQPTLKIRPGYRFNVMVNKDIAFQQPYR